jgi:predicted dehydrogenase
VGRSYRAAVIGHTGRGGYGHQVDVALAGLPGVEVVAVADPDPGGRARAAARCGARRAYASYRDMLERERPDLVAVAPRWVDEHEAMLLAAVEAGAHVYCEKPFLRTPAEADRVLERAATAGVRIAVAHVGRAFAALGRIRALVEAGAVGRLRLLRAYGKCDHRGGGQDLMVLGTHLLDLMRYFAGDVGWAQAHVTQGGRDAQEGDVRPGGEGIGPVAGDGVVAYYAFRSGVAGELESLVAEDGGGSAYSLMLHGTAGTLGIRSHPDRQLFRCHRAVLGPGSETRWEPLALPGHTPEGPEDAGERYLWAHRRLIRDLLEAVEEDREPLASGAGAAAALEMIMAAYAAHFSGRRVHFPLTCREHPLQALRPAPDGR